MQISDGAEDEFDSSNIRLVNWNVHKQAAAEWKQDYDRLAVGSDLVLIQEASLQELSINDLNAGMYWSFAPGYRSKEAISGVMTLSTAKPLTQCSFVNLEPLIQTPKATNITQYGLTGTDETLVVVNIHAVNFSLGLGAYRKQIAQIVETVGQHRGPIILSGDLNTWGTKRAEVLLEFAGKLDLEALSFAEDHRSRMMGQVLDHIFVRGLTVVQSETSEVTTSDHNPMSVTLSMQRLRGRRGAEQL